MNWFFFALLGPILYATTNHIDKALLAGYFREGGVGTLMIFSSLLSIFVLPVFLLIDPSALSVGIADIAILSTVGIMNSCVLWLYLAALNEEDASTVMIFYQLVPMFGAAFGYFLLGETLSKQQVTAMGLILAGTSFVSFDWSGSKWPRFRTRTVFLMSLASFFWASGSAVFKFVALEENVWRSLFWEHIALSSIGLGLFCLVPYYRSNFLRSFHRNSKAILGLNTINEALFLCGNIIFSMSYMLAPVALVLLVNSFQPLFVLSIGVFLTIWFPHIGTESFRLATMIPKIVAIFVTGLGAWLLLAV